MKNKEEKRHVTRKFRAFATQLCVISGLISAIPAEAQTAAPWNLSSKRNINPPFSASSSYALTPAGEIYASGLQGDGSPAPTSSFGNSSSSTISYFTRLNSTGEVIYTVALPGAFGVYVFLDAIGNPYISGRAVDDGFYSTVGAYRATPPAYAPSFICKLRSADGTPVYCTYLDIGGTGFNSVDRAGNVSIVAGIAARGQASPGSLHQGNNIYAAKLNATGTALIYAATFGGSGLESPQDATMDAAGNLFITGRTSSIDFPTTQNAAARVFPAQAGATSFTIGLNTDGAAFLYSTFGAANESAWHMAVDSASEAQILGTDANNNLFVRRYKADGSGIVFESFLQVNTIHTLNSIPQMAMDSGGAATIIGSTNSIAFPAVHPVASCGLTIPAPGQSGEVFLVRVDNTGQVIESSFLPEFGSVSDTSLLGIAPQWTLTVTPSLGRELISGNGALDLVTLAPQTSPASLKLTCIGNAATFTGSPLAPGEIVSLFGTGIGPTNPATAQLGTNQRFPTSVSSTQVTVNGTPAPLLYVSDTQINAVLPFALSLNSANRICVIYAGTLTNCMDTGSQAAAPAVFLDLTSVSPATGSSFAAAVNQDGTVNSQQNPALVGSVVSLFVNGLGPETNAPPDGSLTPVPLPLLNLKVQVQGPNGGTNLFPVLTYPEVLYAGPAPLEIAGLGQINFPVSDASGPIYPVRLIVTLPDGTPAISSSASIWIRPKP
jgi:uncharacterized protein (TIGR03437 family)